MCLGGRYHGQLILHVLLGPYTYTLSMQRKDARAEGVVMSLPLTCSQWSSFPGAAERLRGWLLARLLAYFIHPTVPRN